MEGRGQEEKEEADKRFKDSKTRNTRLASFSEVDHQPTSLMSREAYTDGGRRYDDDRITSRHRDRYVEGERRSGDYKSRGAKGDEPFSSFSSQQVSRSYQRRSHSPDFERDRTRERQSFDLRHGESRREEPDDDQGKDPTEPVFEASGLLAKESNNKNGVALKYAEPPEARKSKKKWRLYVFKDGKEIGKCSQSENRIMLFKSVSLSRCLAHFSTILLSHGKRSSSGRHSNRSS